MKTRIVGLIGMTLLVGALVVGTASVTLARGPLASGGMGYGSGRMMGGSGQSGPSSMMGGTYGPGGMMSGWAQTNPNGPPIILDAAQKDAQAYVDQIGNNDLALDEVLEFQNNDYASVKEKTTGLGAFELLINRSNGEVTPELGPNMMWNTKYGMMSRSSPMGQMMGYYPPTGPMSVTTDQAKQIAQNWLDQNQPGSTTEAPDPFSGYYTVHTLKDGKVSGMLSVNGYTGQVWYHTWHGTFIQLKDLAR